LTGLAGGANPQSGEVAISLGRLNRIEEFDAVGGTAVVQAASPIDLLSQNLTQSVIVRRIVVH
jgi:FAD/FMN-containing dehydrogenase